MKDTTLREILGIAVGEASMCWQPIPKGVFDSSNAIKVTDKLEQAIIEWAISRLPEKVEVDMNTSQEGIQTGWNDCLEEVRRRLNENA